MHLWKCQGCGNQLWVDSESAFVLCTCQDAGDQMRNFRVSHHEHWNALHRFAINASPAQWRKAAAWLVEWQRNIPNFQCACRNHWRELVRKYPPNYSSREAFFVWTVDRHNDVNARLEKQIVSLEEAHRLHGLWVEPKGDGPRVGFMSAAYAAIGGTETWHQAIIPGLVSRGVRVEGFVATGYPGGDPRPLKCTYRIGIDAARQLAANVDVLVIWGIDSIERVLPGSRRPRVICVHHADLQNHWNTGIATQSGIDAMVAVNPEVARVLGGIYIPNAVDPARAIAAEPMQIFQCQMCGHAQVDKVGDGKGFLQVCKQCNSLCDWDSPVTSEQLPIKKKVAVWCARFSPEKRVNLAIDAARLMPDWHFVIIGSGSDQPVSPPANVTLTGALPSQAGWLAASDVFLSTASQEGFGYSMAEAMLASVPVVATPFGLGANAEIVTQLSAHPSPEEIAASIRNADTTKVQKAREFIQQNHSVGAVVWQWASLIASVAAR